MTFIYRLKILLRDKGTLFWTMLFPIILATLFNIAFGNINEKESFQVINVAAIDNEQLQGNQPLRMALEKAGSSDGKLFNVTYTTEIEADKLLDNGKIAGYIICYDKQNKSLTDKSVFSMPQVTLVVKSTGIDQTIIKSFLDDVGQTTSSIVNIILAQYKDGISNIEQRAQNGDLSILLQQGAAGAGKVFEDIAKRETYTKEVPISSAKPDTVLNIFYTLIAMACLYGSFFGMREVSDIQGNITNLGARQCIAPTHKLKLFLTNVSAAFIINFCEIMILMAYLIFILKIDFGSRIGLILLTCLVGCIVGISFGAFLSALLKKSEGIKIAIIISFTMLGCFLAGMMVQSIKYTIAQKAPILSYINPTNLLTDAFYSLHYFDTYTRYLTNMGILVAFALIFCSGTYLILRRQKYASI